MGRLVPGVGGLVVGDGVGVGVVVVVGDGEGVGVGLADVGDGVGELGGVGVGEDGGRAKGGSTTLSLGVLLGLVSVALAWVADAVLEPAGVPEP